MRSTATRLLTSSALVAAAAAALPSADKVEMRLKNSGASDNDAADEGDLAGAIKALAEDLVKRDQEIAGELQKATAELEASGKLSAETKAALEKMSEKAAEIQNRLTEIEQKFARGAAGGGDPVLKSLGERFTDSDEVAAAIKSGQSWRGRARMELKAITSATADANGSAGALIEPTRVPGIVAPPERTLTVRSLITPGRTSSNAIEFVKETGFTNAAAMVAETTAKPESTMKFELETTNVRTLAHWVLASKQILDDVPQLQSYIDGRLRYGLAYVEENQLLLGDGTGQNLLGLIPQATAFDDARRTAGDTKIDTIRRAMTQVRIAEYRATGIVMHPSDWEDIELTKTDDNAYIFANPQASAQPRLWGLPVVDSTAMPEGEFMVGAFRLGAQVFDREQANVEISTEDSDNFRKNMVTIRAEERLALAVYREESFVHGPFEEA